MDEDDDQTKPSEHDDVESFELKPVQAAAIRRAVDLGKLSLPKVEMPASVFTNISGAIAMGEQHKKLIASMASAVPKANVMMLPESTVRSLMGTLRLAEHNNRLMESVAPLLKTSSLAIAGIDTKGLRGRHLEAAGLIRQQSKILQAVQPALRMGEIVGANSKLTESIAKLGIGRVSATSDLMKNVDFALTRSMAATAKQFTASQSKIWETIAVSTRGIVRSFYPANLRDVEGITLAKVKAVAFDEGIPLYLVPRQDTAAMLLEAEGLEARLLILDQRADLILEDCRAVLATCDSDATAGYVVKAEEATGALEAGFCSAAQSLVSSILEALVWDVFGTEKKRYVPDRWGKTTSEAYDEMGAHEFLAFAPVWRAFQQYDLKKGDPIPPTFSRHATAHTISAEQYTRTNALQGLMLASSLLAFVDASRAEEKAA